MFTVEVVSARVSAALTALAAQVRSGLTQSWARIGVSMIAAAVPVVPTKTGRLVATLLATPGVGEVVLEAGGGLLYAGVQNYGWPSRNIAASRFSDPAAEAVEQEAPELLGSEIQNTIDRLGLR